MIMNDTINHEDESDMEEDDDHEEEMAAMMMLLPPPPPPPHIKLLDRRCLDCVISHLDSESRESMAHSCRFLSDACAAADCMPAVGMQDDDYLSDISPDMSSFDTLDLDEASNNPSQDLVYMQYNNSGAQAFISDNLAPSFDEIDVIKGAASPSRDRLSLDDGVKQVYEGGVQALISVNPAPSFDSDDTSPNDIFQTSGVNSCFELSSDSSSISTPASVNDFLCAANGVKTAESEGVEELPDLYAFKPLSKISLKSFHTPQRRTKTPDPAFTPSTQNSSDSDYSESSSDSDDSESANHGVDNISDSESVQSSNHVTKEAEAHPERVTERVTPDGKTFGSFLSDLIGDIFGFGSGSGSAEEVADLLTLDDKVRRNDIDDHGPIKIGEKLYSHNEALKMWRKAKRNLEATYAEVDASGNVKIQSTSYFEKSTMYKENDTRVKDKRTSRNEKPTDRSSTKQGGSLSAAQERSLRKLMMTASLQVEDESVIRSVTQKSTQSTVVNEEVESDNSNIESITQKSTQSTVVSEKLDSDNSNIESVTHKSTQSTVVSEKLDSDNSNNGFSSCPSSFYSSNYTSSTDRTSSSTSSAETSEYNPSQLTWLPHLPPVSSKTDDISVATPMSNAIDSVIGSNYGVEVSSSCFKFVSGKDPPEVIKDAGGYKDATHPARVTSNYGVEVSSSYCKFVSGNDPPEVIKDAGGYKDATTPLRATSKPERAVSTRKPRNISGHVLGITPKRLKNKSVKDDKKKSRSLKLKLIKKAIK